MYFAEQSQRTDNITNELYCLLKWIAKWLGIAGACGFAGSFAAFCWEGKEGILVWWFPTLLLVVFSLWSFYERMRRNNETGSWALLASGSLATPCLWGCANSVKDTAALLRIPGHWNIDAVLPCVLFLLWTILLTGFSLYHSRRCIWQGALPAATLLFLSGCGYLIAACWGMD